MKGKGEGLEGGVGWLGGKARQEGVRAESAAQPTRCRLPSAPSLSAHSTQSLRSLLSHRMIWFRESVISTRDELLSEMLSAMNRPMATKPFHWRRSVSSCLATIALVHMKGSRARKENSMWQHVSSRGNLKPYMP